MTDGSMQSFALTLDRFLDHAAKWHPRQEVVTAAEGGAVERIGYAELKSRSQRVSAVLARLGTRIGDRVATLAWNSQAHVEAWYAIMGMGAVCHTLNPRLTAEQLAAMATRSGVRILIVSSDLLVLAHDIARLAPTLADLLVIDGPADGKCVQLETLIADSSEQTEWGGFDENLPCGLCFTSGTTGAPKGVTYTHRSSYLHTLRLLQADAMAISGRDSVLPVVPMFHANAWVCPSRFRPPVRSCSFPAAGTMAPASPD